MEKNINYVLKFDSELKTKYDQLVSEKITQTRERYQKEYELLSKQYETAFDEYRSYSQKEQLLKGCDDIKCLKKRLIEIEFSKECL